MNRYCEKFGNELPRPKRVCEFTGFAHCTLHHVPTRVADNGYRLCCPECITPFYVVEESEDSKP